MYWIAMTCYRLLLLFVLLCIKSSLGFISSQNGRNRGSPFGAATKRARNTMTAVYSNNNDDTNENDNTKRNDIFESSSLQSNGGDLGQYDPSEGVTPKRQVNVGDPQIKVQDKERSVTSILKELAAIQQQGPQKYCILGTRHCSFLHQQIIELLWVSHFLCRSNALALCVSSSHT